MGLMVGWMAGRVKSGGVGVRVGESASEGGGDLLGQGVNHMCGGLAWGHPWNG